MSKYNTVSFQSLDEGKYLVQSYEDKVIRGEIVYVIYATFNNEKVEFWADKKLSNYIKIYKPTKEFEITINKDETSLYPNSVIIPGFASKVILKSKSP